MKKISTTQKTSRTAVRATDRETAAGPNGLAISPPAYGIDAVDNQVIQATAEPTQAPENRTGLPDKLKAGVETISGLALDDVKVHYNSPQPAQLHALAYTQGTDIHVAPGQEKHLAHEAWHVVQQKQGRVRPTLKAKGVAINNNQQLEKEADVMGTELLQMNHPISVDRPLLYSKFESEDAVIQRVKGWRVFGGVLASIFTLGTVWLSPGFRRYMQRAVQDDAFREKLEDNDFRITADLSQYKSAFGSEFMGAIDQLTEEERWLDGGAGVGQAISDYYEQGGKGLTTAIGFSKPESPVVDALEKREGFKYASGKFFGDMDESDLELGSQPTKVITDYNGILSYTKTLSEDLAKYLRILHVGGKLFTWFYASINGGEVSEADWLARIEGVKVESDPKNPGWVITKTAEKVVVPELKFARHEEGKASNIPLREFTLT